MRYGASLGYGDFLFSREISSCHRAGSSRDLFPGSLGDYPTTEVPGTRSKVYHPIRTAHRVFIVFDDNYGIAHVPQAAQGVEQPPIVAVVQTN